MAEIDFYAEDLAITCYEYTTINEDMDETECHKLEITDNQDTVVIWGKWGEMEEFAEQLLKAAQNPTEAPWQ